MKVVPRWHPWGSLALYRSLAEADLAAPVHERPTALISSGMLTVDRAQKGASWLAADCGCAVGRQPGPCCFGAHAGVWPAVWRLAMPPSITL
eukprot:11747881-Prorocentrum_lima.AAC.1